MKLGWRVSGIALIVALAMLGHDSAMAGRAHDRLPAAEHAVGHTMAAHAHAATGAVPNPGHQDSPSEATADCGVLHPALPSVGDPGLPSLAADAIAGPNVVLAVPIAPIWTEPAWPPGTRRALFQVYRI